MAAVMMCEPLELYNLLNQCRSVSRLAEINYLCLVDARESQDYNTSHIITAKRVKVDSEGEFLLPEAVEVDSMQHVVVYDNNTSCLHQEGRATECAQTLVKASLCPVLILRGGFQRFSALYPFLRTEKTMYTIMLFVQADACKGKMAHGAQELENLKAYPLEIIAEQLYMGDLTQSMVASVLSSLKITAIVSISQSDILGLKKGNHTILNIPVSDSVMSDLYSDFERICSFIESHINIGSRVLVVSRQGRSRSSALVIAFIMHHLKYTLEEAWRYMLRCKPNMRPNTGFLQQLSDWELHTMGARVTDITEPHF